jgi:hypothetical protein
LIRVRAEFMPRKLANQNCDGMPHIELTPSQASAKRSRSW